MNDREQAVVEDWSVVLDAIEESTPESYVRAIVLLLERDTLDEAIATAQHLRRINDSPSAVKFAMREVITERGYEVGARPLRRDQP